MIKLCLPSCSTYHHQTHHFSCNRRVPGSYFLEERYAVWKQNCPYLYDLIFTHNLEWPSLTVDWLPGKLTEHSPAGIILGTHTANMVQNHLLLAQIRPPHDTISAPIHITNSIPHPTEVNRARHMPQKPHIIATKTGGSDTLVFDFSAPQKKSQTMTGHSSEGYGLSWNRNRPGFLISGSRDQKICLWDTLRSDSTLPAIFTLSPHNAPVEDVQWNPCDTHTFVSGSSEGSLAITDIRTPDTSTIVGDAHTGCVLSVSISPFSDRLILSGSADGTSKLWDSRNLANAVFAFPSGPASKVQWSWRNHTVFATSSGNEISIWDLKEVGKEADEAGPSELLFVHGGHTAPIRDFAWSESEPWLIASVASNNILHVWQLAQSIFV